MTPLHEGDLAEERWLQSEWGTYELWEKQELRLKRRQRIWIITTGIIFLILSSIPILIDRWPKWFAVSVARVMAQEINRLKKDAIVNRAAFRLELTESLGLGYRVRKVANCGGTKSESYSDQELNLGDGQIVRTGYFVEESLRAKYAWLTPEQGEALNIPGLVQEICYDDLLGNSAAARGVPVIGIGIIPANDLTEKRLDRISVLLLSGPSAEISFN